VAHCCVPAQLCQENVEAAVHLVRKQFAELLRLQEQFLLIFQVSAVLKELAVAEGDAFDFFNNLHVLYLILELMLKLRAKFGHFSH